MQPRLTSYGLAALQRGLAEAPEMAKREMLVAATEAVNLLQADVVGRYPHHSGLTRGSIGAEASATPVGVLGLVGTANPVAAFIELGTKPHTPPLEPLLLWVADVLGKTGDEGEAAALGIQRKIRAKGTQANPIFRDAEARNLAAVSRIFENAAGRVAAALEGGRA